VRAQYNRANALARAGKLQQALDAYEQVLAEQPDHADARYNRDLIKELLKQQKKQQEQQDKSGKQADQQNSRSSSQSGDNSRSDGSQSSTGDSSKQQQNGQPSPPGGDEEQPQSQEQQSRGGQDPDGQKQQPQQESPAALNPEPLSQSQEQWLRRVPDNPGGLLQRKFLQQYQQRGREADEEDTPW
jgi:Ca-activated chloride channel family protein